jgi:hypothetical protein
MAAAQNHSHAMAGQYLDVVGSEPLPLDRDVLGGSVLSAASR